MSLLVAVAAPRDGRDKRCGVAIEDDDAEERCERRFCVSLTMTKSARERSACRPPSSMMMTTSAMLLRDVLVQARAELSQGVLIVVDIDGDESVFAASH